MALKPVPVRITVAPTGPLVGAKEVSAGEAVEGEGDAVSPLVRAAAKVAVAAAGREAATTVVIVAPPDSAAVVLAVLLLFEELDELPVPLSEMVMAFCASFSVKSDCTVWATVPVAAVDVR